MNNTKRKRLEAKGWKVGTVQEFLNLSPEEAKDYISIDSPMARALMKKEVGEEAVVKTDAGEFVWHVKKIEYQK